MWKLIYFLCVIILVYAEDDDNSNILCSDRFCEEYIKKTPCPAIPKNCNIQNATHNGIILPFDGPCNCCKYCVDNLQLDDECIIGSPDGPLPTMICGDGLYCDNVTSKCIARPVGCIKEQQDFDQAKADGTLGNLQLRPKCDKRGQYEPLKCIPGQTCFCVDKDGERIFGEMTFKMDADDRTKCECARVISDVNKILGITEYSTKRTNCLSDGNFNPIQCVNKECICVNKFNGSPSNPDEKPVNINLVSEMSCFDENIHPKGTYLQNCEKEYLKSFEEIEYYNEIGYEVIGFPLPACQLDGRYGPVQKNLTHVYCADPEGELLEDFLVTRENQLASSMNCNCARARSIIPFIEEPECCYNGNYECIQCRRDKCRCVDKNGLQTQQEVNIADKDTLSCQNCELCTY